MITMIHQSRFVRSRLLELTLGLATSLGSGNLSAAAILNSISGLTPGEGPETSTQSILGLLREQRVTDSARREAIEQTKRRLAQGDWADAARELEQAASRSPQNASIQVALGELYNRLQRPRDAIAAADRALEIEPMSPTAYDIIGIAQRLLGDLDQAREALERVVALAPESERGHLHLGELYFTRGDDALALQHLDQVLARNPSSEPALLKTAVLLLDQGRHEEALARARRLLEIDPDQALAYGIIGDAEAQAGESDRAEQAYREALARRPDLRYFSYRLGDLYSVNHETDKAIAVFAQWIARTPGDSTAHLRLANLYDTSGATALATYHRGVIALSEGRPTEAKDRFLQALGADPGLALAYLGLARAQLRLGDRLSAEQALRQVTGSGKLDASALTLLGDLRAMSRDRAGAEAAYRRAVGASAEAESARIRLGDLLASDGRCSEAMELYSAAVALAPERGATYRSMAQCASTLGDISRAETLYCEALRRDPSDPIALNGLAWLLARQGKSLKLALWLAERAATLRPSEPAIIDTLGWLYHLDGQGEVAVRNLRIAASALPGESTVGYHLAAALADQGEQEESAALLRRLLAGDDFPERKAARALLDSLSGGQPARPSD